MIVGIVSDTHGRVDRLGRAVEALTRGGIEAIVHCGDIGDPACLAVLAGAGVPAYAVAGNMDKRSDLLAAEAERHQVTFAADSVALPLAEDKLLAVTHGNRPDVVSRLLADEKVVYLCCGHTHIRFDGHVRRTHIINPGALSITGEYSVAILDTDADSVEFVTVV